jgi:hypothetical protein
MSSVSSNLRFSVDFILENRKKSGGDKSGEYWGWFNYGISCFAKITALLTLQCEVSPCYARGTSFVFPETEVLLDDFLEPNEAVLPRNIPYSPPDLAEKIFANDSRILKNMTNITLIVYFWNRFFVSYTAWRAPFHALYICLAIVLETSGPIPPVTIESSKEQSVSKDRINLRGLQSESLLFIGQIVRNKPSADLPCCEIFH